MKRLLLWVILSFFGLSPSAFAGDYLVKIDGGLKPSSASDMNLISHIQGMSASAVHVKALPLENWVKVSTPEGEELDLQRLQAHPYIQYVQKNYKYGIFQNPYIAQQTEIIKEKFSNLAPRFKGIQEDCPFHPIICAILGIGEGGGFPGFPGGGENGLKDNPDIPASNPTQVGADPLFDKQWGMKDVQVTEAHKVHQGSPEVVVAIIDTGVDYTHEDLVNNLWRNPGEMGEDANGKDKSTNGVDDDGNGYVDDVIGWDFVDNDNKPYDLKGANLLQGGNPGHGTHCAGNAAAQGNNQLGVKGVAPNVKIMPLRFISADGQGTTEAAVAAIRYAIDNGATVTSNSWGVTVSREEAAKDKLLKEALDYSQEKGVLFVAAAGNGNKMGVGFDNDSSQTPAYPASFEHDIIVSVAATDIKQERGSFSNWGATSVDIAAPGVEILSTAVGNLYQDKVKVPLMGEAPWAGTSMATPFVSGAAALYISANPSADWRSVKDRILSTATPTPSMQGKAVSNGRLNVGDLMTQPPQLQP